MATIDNAKFQRQINVLKRRTMALKRSAGEQVVQSALLAGSRETVKIAKAQMPHGMKYLNRGIRARVVRRKKRGERIVKAGFGVGMSRKKQDAVTRRKTRGRGKGAGISIRNIHWLVLGLKTKNRVQKTTGRPTGTHGPKPTMRRFMVRAAAKSRGRFIKALHRVGNEKLNKQLEKIKRTHK